MQSQSLSFRQTLSCSLDQRLELAQRMQTTMRGIRKEFQPMNPEYLIKEVIMTLLDQVKDQNVKSAIGGLDTLPGLYEYLVQYCETLTSQRRGDDFQGQLRELFAGFLHEKVLQEGRLAFYGDDQRVSEYVGPVSRGVLIDALKAPVQFESEFERLKHTYETHAVRESADAMRISQALRELYESVCGVIGALCFLRDAHGERLLYEFLKDTAILERLDLLVSDRLERRFVKRFAEVSAQTKSVRDHAEICFVNTFAEFTLISMGIVSPELFTVRRGDLELGDIDEALDKGSSPFGDTKSMVVHYYGRSEGTFFYNRYAVKGIRPTRITEHNVRAFLNVTVRKSQREVLEACDFPKFLERVIEVNRSGGDVEERREDLVNIFLDHVSGETFQKRYLELLKRWHPHLSVFYRAQQGSCRCSPVM